MQKGFEQVRQERKKDCDQFLEEIKKDMIIQLGSIMTGGIFILGVLMVLR